MLNATAPVATVRDERGSKPATGIDMGIDGSFKGKVGTGTGGAHVRADRDTWLETLQYVDRFRQDRFAFTLFAVVIVLCLGLVCLTAIKMSALKQEYRNRLPPKGGR